MKQLGLWHYKAVSHILFISWYALDSSHPQILFPSLITLYSIKYYWLLLGSPVRFPVQTQELPLLLTLDGIVGWWDGRGCRGMLSLRKGKWSWSATSREVPGGGRKLQQPWVMQHELEKAARRAGCSRMWRAGKVWALKLVAHLLSRGVLAGREGVARRLQLLGDQ